MPIGLLGALPAIGAGIGAITGFFDQRRRNQGMDEDRDYLRGTRNIAGNQAGMILNNPGSFFEGADPRSIREQASQFHNPYQSQVIDGIRGQYDQLREKAHLNQAAGSTLAGAFGGDRHQLQLGARLGELDTGESQQVGNLLHSDWQNSVSQGLQYSEYQRALRERQAQEPVWRANQAVGLRQQGMGPTGLPQGGSPLAAGLGTGLSLFSQGASFLDKFRNRNRGQGPGQMSGMGMLPNAYA